MTPGLISANERRPGTLRSFRGRELYVPDLDLKAIQICDIALALSKECRFLGRCRGFYSVAEHLCHCFDVARTFDMPWMRLREILLHDAAEAYVRDMPSPVKRILPDYQGLEKLVTRRIHEKFGVRELGSAGPGLVKLIDLIVLKAERVIVRDGMRDWNLEQIPTAVIPIQRWTPRQARREFLRRWRVTDLRRWENGSYVAPSRFPDPTQQIRFL